MQTFSLQGAYWSEILSAKSAPPNSAYYFKFLIDKRPEKKGSEYERLAWTPILAVNPKQAAMGTDPRPGSLFGEGRLVWYS